MFFFCLLYVAKRSNIIFKSKPRFNYIHQQEHLMETFCSEKEMPIFSLQVIFVDKTICNSHSFKKIYDFATTQYAVKKSEFLSIFYENPLNGHLPAQI